MKVAAFYRFLNLADPAAFRDALFERCARLALVGTVLVAGEGINGTLAGTGADVQQALDWATQVLRLAVPLEARWTYAPRAPFRKLRVQVRKEIVTLGRPDLLPHEQSGRYVTPQDWNALIDDPNVQVIDTRNHYEVEVGTFPRALNPQTASFREFPAYAETLADADRSRPVAMFCTGGIRCEKATALMLELGFEDVHHLQGGILNYLQQVSPEESRWQGECFIFDTRVALDRDLAEGGYVQCHACRRPLSAGDLASPEYREGVSCPKCVAELDPDRAARLEERRRQVDLARRRGEQHIGPKTRA